MKKSSIYLISLFMSSMFMTKMMAQTTITISLKVNGEKTTTVFHNEPVLFDVAISNQQAQANERWNISADRRLQEMVDLVKLGQLKQEEYDKEKALIEKNKRRSETVVLDAGSSSWTSSLSWKVINTTTRNEAALPVKQMKNPATEGKAILDANAFYMACYGISPDDLKSVPSGTYSVEFSINNDLSNTVVLKVENGMMSEALAGSEPLLLRTGMYYWHAGDAAKTIQYADKLLAKNPVSLDALSLKGDGQVLQRSYLLALETYNKAVREYFKQNGNDSEPPEYLFHMIAFIKKELGNN